MLRNNKYTVGALATIGLLLGVLLLQSNAADEIHLTGPTMGTTYNVKYVATNEIEHTNIKKLIDEKLVRINKLMSTYDPNSELSQFNQSQSNDVFPISPETKTVIEEAIRLGNLSDGILDVTVGPLVNLWGFGPQGRPEEVPSENQIQQAMQRVGLDKIELHSNGISKTNPDLYLDLSTIAKGYGVDQIALILEQNGLHNYLVEVGGEMRLSGVKSSGEQWRIAVEKPITTERAAQRIMQVGNNAVATSGDYRNYFEENGVRYSHLINPTTGYPIEHNLVAVTVIHPSSMTADGLATALNVMGKDAALALAAENNLAVMLITRENGEFKEYTSDKFSSIVRVVQ